MIISDKEATARLNSPINLINQISSNSTNKRNNSPMNIFGMNKQPASQASPQASPEIEVKEIEVKEESFNPFQKSQSPKNEPTSAVVEQALTKALTDKTSIDNLIDNSESQIRLGLAHDSALNVLTRSLDMLSTKLDDIKADKLPAVVSAASKTVESIRRERSEASKNNKGQDVHYHFYTPVQRKISDFEVIEVTQ